MLLAGSAGLIYGVQDPSCRTTGTSPGWATTSRTGVSNGAIWALIALGYTLVYGIIELINFAHGELFMLGSLTAVALYGTFGLTPPRTPATASSSGCWSSS